MPRARPSDHPTKGEKPPLDALHEQFEGCIRYGIAYAVRHWARELGISTEWLNLILQERVGTGCEDIYDDIWVRLIRYYETVPVEKCAGDGDHCTGCKKRCKGNGHYYGVTRPGEERVLFNVSCDRAKAAAKKLARGYDPKKAALRTWIIMLTRRIVRDQIRVAGQKRNTGTHVYLDDDTKWQSDKYDPTFDGVERRESWIESICGTVEATVEEELEIDHSEIAPLIRQNLKALDDKHRAILEHAYYDGLSDAQIADLYDNLGGMERQQAINVIRRIRKRGEAQLREAIEEALKDPDPDPILVDGFQTRLVDMPLSAPTVAALTSAGIETFAELVCYTETDLLTIRNLGLQRLAEIKMLVLETGLDLGINPEAMR